MQVENEDLIFTLETLVERFDEEMAPYAVGLTQHLLHSGGCRCACAILLSA